MKDMLSVATHDCFKEMYAKAQPSADYDVLLQQKKDGLIEDSNENPIYSRYYLSQEEFIYIKDKYINKYNLKHTWIPNVELVESYLKNGGSRDKYIGASIDKNGFEHSGYSSYEKVKPLLNQFIDCIGDEKKATELVDIVMNNISDCKNFYKFDRAEDQFSISVSLGASPSSNEKAVKEYWKKQGIDIEIEHRNPLLLWEMDEYGDEFENIMRDEYGDNWKEEWDEKYEDSLKKEKAEKQIKYEELVKNYKYHQKFSVGDHIRSVDIKSPKTIVKVNDNTYTVDDNGSIYEIDINKTDKEYKLATEFLRNY